MQAPLHHPALMGKSLLTAAKKNTTVRPDGVTAPRISLLASLTAGLFYLLFQLKNQNKYWSLMITLPEYFGKWLDHPDATGTRQNNARRLLAACAALEAEMIAAGVEFPINPKTGTGVSGTEYGGFRPQCCVVGAKNSSHKEGRGVDRYDPHHEICDWLLSHQESLRNHGLYIEHPVSTLGWSHWTDRSPLSGRTIFFP